VVRLSLSLLNGLDQAGVLLKDIKAHLEDVMHLKLISEALLLMIRVNVAECLATRRMFNSHFFLVRLLNYYN